GSPHFLAPPSYFPGPKRNHRGASTFPYRTMNRRKIAMRLPGALLVFAVSACAQAGGPASPVLPLLPPSQALEAATWTGQAVSAPIVGGTGEEIGTLTVRPGQDGVVVR